MDLTLKTLHLEDVLANHGQDMTGKIVAVTGTTSGTGYVCARELARKGATVILLNRQSQRATESAQNLQQEVPNGVFDAITCDLQDFASVQTAIDTIKSKYDKLDVLVNNAGVMALKDQATKDGYDVQIQTNVLSHFLLTKGLFPLLMASGQGRVVNHSSMARLGDPLDMKYFGKNGGNLGGDGTPEENLSFKGPRWQRYHQTKLANCAFTYGLKEKLEAAGIDQVIPLLAHPGLALTQLQFTTTEDGGMQTSEELMSRGQSAEDGATGIIRAAMDPEAQSGDFFGPENWKGYPDRLPPEDLLFDEANIRVNWEGCEAAVGTFSFSGARGA
ncbi:SDR family NAD(P)-dependent oxidoreductase [Pontibacter sp. G13]|uniref:SDR family NAD(P)-dependent oxidoreductase n=1 Tax=Pontibacter sp. G13 TaxID=3074898 RepID=UPI002889367F|nr:SDR family NAD(P)-dependent oxidoreductase [Pontibacter sp. G13]WNJ20510.1 SDR family NAD(P)-dependent oxidoreductase [Pontibacter sp. G13]